MTLLPMSQSRRRNSLSTLEYSTITVFGRDIVLFVLENNFYCIYKLLFFCTSFQRPIKSLRPRIPRAALAFSSHFVVFAVLSHVHPLFHFFFCSTGFFNLCKAGITWTPRNIVSFLFIYPQNRNLSSLQSCSPPRTASSGLWTVSALLLCICGPQAQVRIKVFICFTVGSRRIFFPPAVAGSYPTAAVSVHSSQCLAEVGDAEI